MYYIVTDRGLKQTTRRQALLHAGRTADSAKYIGSSIVGPKNTNFLSKARDIHHACTSRGNNPPMLTNSMSKVYLQSRLRARKLKVGLRGIRKFIGKETKGQTTYRVINTSKSRWLIEGITGKLGADSMYHYTRTTFLISRLQGRALWVYEAPGNVRTCQEALDHYRSTFTAGPWHGRRWVDRRAS